MRDAIRTVFRREFASYFTSPLALIFVVIFLVLSGVFTFYVGQFFERGQADLQSFFMYHPWLYLFLLPALSMRLWSEERKSGTIELLLTLPLPLEAVVIGKYLAALAVATMALVLTFPIWITVNVLGDPDNGMIMAGYFGSFLLAAGYLAIGSAISATSRNQVIAFVVAVVTCFFFTVAGLPMVLDAFEGWLSPMWVSLIASFSFLTHYSSIMQGVIDGRDVAYFASLVVFWLFVNVILVDATREADG
ncbi:MAG: ABC transporter permease subunit [Sphingomonadales bacterium]|nr:ABC transporter permease subunit [Sphingomonadales bacterium]